MYEVHPFQLKEWRAQAVEGLPNLLEKQDSTAELQATHEEQLIELYAEIGKLTTQVACPQGMREYIENTRVKRRKAALIETYFCILTVWATICNVAAFHFLRRRYRFA